MSVTGMWGKSWVLWGCVMAGLIGGAPCGQASPSGLNNIPTADSCPVQTVELQTWEGFGGDAVSENWIGLKYGLIKNGEIGVDWKTSGNPGLQPQFQGKYTLDVGNAWPQFCVGIANVSTDKNSNGEPMPYGVMTYDLMGWLRAHAGYGFQAHNDGLFGGLDRTFDVAGLHLMLCGDVIQTNDRRDALLAPGIKISPADCKLEGILGTLIRRAVIETWVNLPTNGDAESYVVKLDYDIHF